MLQIENRKTETKSSNATQNLFSKCGTIKHWVPQGSTLGPLLSINDLPPTINIH
jgi:hypothetical protein